MPTSHRLRKHADYQQAYAGSRKQFTRQTAYFFALRPADRRSDTPGPRVGITVPKALGKAHERNRIKQRIRAAIASNLSLLTGPIDVILHPRRLVLTLDFVSLNREIATVFRAAQSGINRGATAKPRSPGIRTENSLAATPSSPS